MSASSTTVTSHDDARTGKLPLFAINALIHAIGICRADLRGHLGVLSETLSGHSPYGQTLTLCIFMGGMGIGALLAARYIKTVKNPFLMYALVELLIGLGGFFTTICTRSAPRAFMKTSPERAPSPPSG